MADYHGTGMTVGPHPMAYRRENCGKWASCQRANSGSFRTIGPPIAAGCVITRQRPWNRQGPHLFNPGG